MPVRKGYDLAFVFAGSPSSVEGTHQPQRVNHNEPAFLRHALPFTLGPVSVGEDWDAIEGTLMLTGVEVAPGALVFVAEASAGDSTRGLSGLTGGEAAQPGEWKRHPARRCDKGPACGAAALSGQSDRACTCGAVGADPSPSGNHGGVDGRRRCCAVLRGGRVRGWDHPESLPGLGEVAGA